MIVTSNTPLGSPIKNNVFQFFKITKRRKALQPKVPLLKASISLFQLYIATTERHGDNLIWIRFSHTKSTRSRLRWRTEMRRCIIRQNPKNHPLHREGSISHGSTETYTQQQHDCVVQDGGQLIHQLDAQGTGTFEQFTQRLFLKHLQVELRKVSRLDIVWDTYRPMSIKGHTHDERGHSVRLKVGPNVRIHGNWSEFLRDSTNKGELF